MFPVGLKINFGKSSLYGWNEPDIQSWADILGCKVGVMPIHYLGAYIGSSPRRKVFWKPLLYKFDLKLIAWKKNSINQAGRKVLVKACLNRLPVYWFHLHKIPKGILNQIDRKRRNFFWGDRVQEGIKDSKLHLVKWNTVCNPKNKGGLGPDNLISRNSALLFKWWWKWFLERKGF